MNLRQIEVFRAVMAAGSITDAARMLHVSQPGVSRLVRHLEIQLGVALFERRKGRLFPTPEAHTLHGEIERVYRGVVLVQDVAAHLRYGADSPLRVLASSNVSLQLVPQAIAALVAGQPRVRVSFEMLAPREIGKRLVAEEADLGFSSAAIEHPALLTREIGRWRIVCAIPRDHPMAARKQIVLSEVLRERLVLYGPDAPQSATINGWLQQHGIARHAAVEVRSGYAACALAAAGAGMAFVDELSARAHRSDGLVFRALTRAPRFPIYSVVNAHRPPSRLGQALLARVQSALADMLKQGAVPLPGGK